MDLPILFLFIEERSKLPFTVRIERAHSSRARSASKKGARPLLSLLADFFSIRIKGIILADGWNARQPQVAGNVRHRTSHPHERRTYGSSLDECRSSQEDWFAKVRPNRLRDSPEQYKLACEQGRHESLGRVRLSWRAR